MKSESETKNKRCTAKTEVYSRVVGFYRPVQQWNKGKKEREFEKSFDFKKYKVMEIIYKISQKAGEISGMPVRKIAILEKTNLSPKQLKDLYTKMVKDDLVTDQGESLTLTDFGGKYFEVFLKKDD